MTIRAKYTGALDSEGRPREYLQGIPARDIDEDEWRSFSNEQRAEVRGSAIYSTKTDAEMHGSSSSAGNAQGETPQTNGEASVDLHADDDTGGGE